MAELSVQIAARTGVTMIVQDITGTSGTPDTFVNNGRTFVQLYNQAGTATTVYFKFITGPDGRTPDPREIVVPATTTANPILVGPFPVLDYGAVMSVYTSDTDDTEAYIFTF